MSRRAARDRYAGLVFFGVVEILVGLVALLMIPMLVIGARVSAPAGAASETFSRRMLVPSAMVYLGTGALLLTLGVGSILARRWARALMVVFSAL